MVRVHIFAKNPCAQHVETADTVYARARCTWNIKHSHPHTSHADGPPLFGLMDVWRLGLSESAQTVLTATSSRRPRRWRCDRHVIGALATQVKVIAAQQ